jgi:hypothetical protein
VLEMHGNGDLLDSLDTVLAFARSMTWKGKQPSVELITKVYQKGVRLSQAALAALETKVRRLPGLGNWFVQIRPETIRSGTLF